MPNSKIPVILLAFANDDGRSLRQLDEEQKAVRQILEPGRKEGKFEVQVLAAATAADVIRAFQENRNRIVVFHYGGHSEQDELFFRKNYQDQHTVKAENLADFLALHNGLELIFLNSCLSLDQAKAYQEAGVNAVVATGQKINDEAARQFASFFYQALASGLDLTGAFQEAEKSMAVHSGGAPRGQMLKSETDPQALPWQMFPTLPAPWRLPLVAHRLTRIPSIDLDKEFIGRDADMQRLKKKLEDASKVVLMNGLGGIGKTVLATAFINKYGIHYDHLVWINRGEDLIASVALNEYLADTLGMPFEREEELAARFSRILRKLDQLPGQNLLVIDNALEQVAQKEIYDQLPGYPNWQVLLTSRLSLSGFDRLPLDTLQPEAARQLFHTHFKGKCTEEDLDALLIEVGYHTLTVELLARLLDKLSNLLSVSDLTGILQQKQLNDPDLQEMIYTNHSGDERGIYLHLMKAFELIRLTEREKWVLKQFVVLPVEPYPVPLLAGLLQEKPLSLNKLLNSLAAKGWLTKHENKAFSIHRLIRTVVEYQLEVTFEDLERVIDTLIAKTEEDPFKSFVASIPWLEPAEALCAYFPNTKSPAIAKLQDHLGIIYRKSGQLEVALNFHKKSIEIEEFLSKGSNTLIVARYYNNVAIVYGDLGQYEMALDYHRKAIDIKESFAATDPSADVGASYNNIALVYLRLNQHEDALKYFLKAIDDWLDHNESDHPDLATMYNNIAIAYKRLENHEKEMVYHQKAIAIREEKLAPDHPDLAQSYSNIAITYNTQGENEVALDYHKKAIAIWESILDGNHPYLAISYDGIGVVYRQLERYEEALFYNKKAIAVEMTSRGENHPVLISYHNNLAEIYRNLENHEQALFSYIKAAAIIEKLFSLDHIDLANAYENIGLTYYLIWNEREALNYYQKAIDIKKSLQGDDHIDLAEPYFQIGHIYHQMGQYRLGLKFSKKALRIQEKWLEPADPAFAYSYGFVAQDYEKLGQIKKSVHYYKKAIFFQESVWTDNQLQLANSYFSVGNLLVQLGNYWEALDFLEKSLRIKEAMFDKNHHHLAITYDNIAGTLRMLGQFKPALDYHKKSLAIWEASPDDQPFNRAQSYQYIALTYGATGQHQAALQYLQKSIKIWEQEPNNFYDFQAIAYNNIAHIHAVTGSNSEAQRYLQKSLDTLESKPDADHVMLVTFFSQIAETYRALGQQDKAKEHFTKAKSYRKDEEE